MDVSDLKGLYVEVNKRMKTALDHLQHEFGGVRHRAGEKCCARWLKTVAHLRWLYFAR